MIDLTDLTGHLDTLRDIRAKQDELAAIRAELENTIKTRLGDHETGTVNGAPVVHWKHGKRTALSHALLKQLHPAVFYECHDTTLTRRFELL